MYPRPYSEAGGCSNPWLMQTQCLVAGNEPIVNVKVRFLQVVERRVARKNAAGTLDCVDELRVGREQYLAWQEATERGISIEGSRLSLLDSSRRVAIEIPAGRTEESAESPRWRGGRGAGA